MQAVDVLKAEHRRIETVLDAMDAMVARWAGRAGADAAAAADALAIARFLREYADQCHHGKEETHLFRLMEQRGFSPDQGPTAVMRHEHEIGRAHVRGMWAAAEQMAAGRGATEARPLYAAHAEAFGLLLREHIQKEDQVLFRFAQQCLTEQDQRELQALFDEVQAQQVAAGVIGRAEETVARLAATYGVAVRMGDGAAVEAGAAFCCPHGR